MKVKLFRVSIACFFIALMSCNKSNDSKKIESETNTATEVSQEIDPYAKFDSDSKPNLYETSQILLDTIFNTGGFDIRLKVRMREDLASRNIVETYQCESEGLLVSYGNEFILEFFGVNEHKNGGDLLIGRNYVNIDLIKKMDYSGKIERRENLSSFEGIGSLEKNRINLKFGTVYAVGEGSNNIELGFDLTRASDYCKIGGASSIKITNPYD